MARRFIQNNKGQMLLLEVISFAILLILAVYFVYELSPPRYSTLTQNQDELAIKGFDTLRSIDALPSDELMRSLAEYIYYNEYEELFWLIDQSLPSMVEYNLYVSDGKTTTLWPLGATEKTRYGTVSHASYIISLPGELAGFTDDNVYCYNVILEMWR